MKRTRPRRVKGRRAEGYALLLIMCLLTLAVLATVAIAPNVLTEIQRDREEEMIWRGKQYARGVKLFYQKLHRFPPTLEDLSKAQMGVRFMRQAYKDPMNTEDGSWRLIYLGPSGQLIGSTRTQAMGPNGAPAQGFGTPISTSGASPFGSQSVFGGGSGTSVTSAAQTSGSATGGSSTTAPNPNDPNAPADAQGSGTSQGAGTDMSNIIGGSIIGVGSKVRKPSFRWYEKAHNYHDFEFIWDPSKDIFAGMGVGQSGGLGNPVGVGAPGTVPPVTPGTNPPPPSIPGTGTTPEVPLQAPPNPN